MKSDENSRNTAAYYLERAVECERLTGAAMTAENREILLRLAARWRAFAAERTEPPENLQVRRCPMRRLKQYAPKSTITDGWRGLSRNAFC